MYHSNAELDWSDQEVTVESEPNRTPANSTLVKPLQVSKAYAQSANVAQNNANQNYMPEIIRDFYIS
jgi:hypothetical protein